MQQNLKIPVPTVEKLREQGSESWRQFDFEGLRRDLSDQIDAIIRQVDAKQEEGRTNNNQQLEDIALVNSTAASIQKELTKNLVATSQTITQVEKANFEFDQTLQESGDYRYQITSQVDEIEHLMRLLNYEISQQNATKQKIEYVVEKEKDLQRRKDVDEAKLVQMVTSDLDSQIRNLDSQVQVLSTAEENQVRIQNELVDLWKSSCVELETILKNAKAERDQLSEQLSDLRHQAHQKMVSNEQTMAVNTEVEFEVQRMTDYASALQDNLENMAKDYQDQFDSVLGAISAHNTELSDLQEQHSQATKTLYEIAIDNERIESELLGLKAERDVHVIMDERHKVEMLKVDTADAIRRAERMEHSCSHTIQQWQNRVNVLQREVMAMQQSSEEEIQHGLIERLMGQIKTKNEQLTELSRQKLQIESNLTEGVDETTMNQMQNQIEKLIADFELAINNRIEQRQIMISELTKIQGKSQRLNWAHEDIKRVKCAIDLAQKDIHQKRQVSIEMANEMEEIQTKNQELDEEIAEYVNTLEVEETKLHELNEQAKLLSEEVDAKEAELLQLEDELVEAESAREHRESEDRRREAQLAADLARRPKYVPIQGDTVDELMAKHLNESKYHIEVRALGEGHYMLGNKKIFAKIVAEKLVIKQGGGFMLIDEFIKNYSEGNTMTGQSSMSNLQASGRMSPKRGGIGPASPKRKPGQKM